MTVHGLLDSTALFQQLEGNKRSLIPCVLEAGLATSDDVELVVSKLQSLMDPNCDR
jgi:hypothetical protein